MSREMYFRSSFRIRSKVFSKFISSAIFLILFVYSPICFVQAYEQCQTIIQSVLMSDTCESLGNCTGIRCTNATSGHTTSFSIDKCQDPLLVTVTLLFNNQTVLYNTYNSSTAIAVTENVIVGLNLTRNNTYASVEIIGWSLTPVTAIPLNTTSCMCQSIQDIVNKAETPFEFNCMNNSECSGLQCSFPFNGEVYNVDTEVLPCTDPPGFVLIIRRNSDGFVVYQQFFNSSANSSVFGIPLHVVIIHRQYSMLIEVYITINGQDYQLVPLSQIILDKTSCSLSIPESTNTVTILSSVFYESTIPIIHPTSVPTLPATCEKIRDIASLSSNGIAVCQSNDNEGCDTISCTLFGYVSKTKVLPCHNPPGFHVTITDPDNNALYDKDITKTTNVQVSGITITFAIDHDEPNAIGLNVTYSSPFGLAGTIIPHTEIPIDPCLCANPIVTSGCEITVVSTPVISMLSTKIASTGLTIILHSPTPKTGSNVSYVAIVISVPLVVVCLFIIGLFLFLFGFVILFKRRISRSIGLNVDRVRLTDVSKEDESQDDE